MNIGGRYEVEREIGRGSFGVVYRARDADNLDRPVVVKVLLHQADEQTRRWIESHFLAEASALGRIDHPGVVKLISSGTTPEGYAYFAMDLVEGRSLRTYVDPRKGLVGGDALAARFVREIGSAVSAAHDVGVYHRDLKPENVMVTDANEGRIKVIDFGIATVKDRLDETTKATLAAGTLEYMAPEQFRGKPSASSDVYALGVIAYELLTGRLPFTSDLDSTPARMAQLQRLQQEGLRVKPRDLRPSLPIAAQTAVVKALALDPKERFARADEFGEALASALAPEGGTSSTLDADTTGPAERLETADVLFCDIVSYSTLAMDVQRQYLKELNTLVRQTETFHRAVANESVIALPTGDGMAMAFFGAPLAAVECAVELATALRRAPHIRLRIGINSGPVYHVDDINANRNVAGGGINLAQRVMDFGDAGHILVAESVASVLRELSGWRDRLHDLGTHAAKHGVQLHVYNLVADEYGNPETPTKLRARSRRRAPLVAGVAVVVLLGVLAAWAITRATRTTAEPGPAIPSPPATAPVAHELDYWATLQPSGGGPPIRMSGGVGGETFFSTNDELTFSFVPSHDGHLYIYDVERPADGKIGIVRLVYPSPTVSDDSRVVADREARTSPLVFDPTVGDEQLWVAWSEAALEPSESDVRRSANREMKGVISDADRRRELLAFLERASGSGVSREPNATAQRMRVRSAGDTIVFAMRLTHR
jgi:serine/threonine protein kinase